LEEAEKLGGILNGKGRRTSVKEKGQITGERCPRRGTTKGEKKDCVSFKHVERAHVARCLFSPRMTFGQIKRELTSAANSRRRKDFAQDGGQGRVYDRRDWYGQGGQGRGLGEGIRCT